MTAFNPDRPHAEVFGLPGVKFQQSGCYFTAHGQIVGGDPDRDRQIAEVREVLADPKTEPEVREAYRERLAALTAAKVEVQEEPPVMKRGPGRPPRSDADAMKLVYGETE